MAQKASLTVVGTGIKFASQLTPEAEGYIRQADKLFYVVPGPFADEWLTKLNPTAESLAGLYAEGKKRLDTYEEMANTILTAVRQDQKVCAIFYGHPGVFAIPSHEAIRLARAEGYAAQMLPGISAEDCLFADLGIDPGIYGCQSFEATDFLVRQRRFDPYSHLVLWQVGIIGEVKRGKPQSKVGIQLLAQTLRKTYEPTHEVVVYEAARYPIHAPRIERLTLATLGDMTPPLLSTLYVPPKGEAPLNQAIMDHLNLTIDDVLKQW
ncbi:MAG: SAM-dependent methyltransferase [Chloroflexota bacterium]